MQRLFVPDTEQAAEDDEFAEVVGGVVGDEESFAEEVLAFTPAEGLVEIDAGFLEEGFELGEIAADGGDGVIPGVTVWEARGQRASSRRATQGADSRRWVGRRS